MLLTTEGHRVDHEPAARVEPPLPRIDAPMVLDRRAHVAVVRHRPAIGLGALSARSTVSSDRLVTARDLDGRAWWIPAEAVWSDADHADRPEHPRPVGLATALTCERATATGLSDRLGWEAVMAFERGAHLPRLDTAPAGGPAAGTDRLVVLDGRLGHEVPTVVVLGDELVRWGAGATWSTALHRALFGDDGSLDVGRELGEVAFLLACGGLDVVGVDLGTALLRNADVVRWSVQLVPSDVPGRSWDADSVD